MLCLQSPVFAFLYLASRAINQTNIFFEFLKYFQELKYFHCCRLDKWGTICSTLASWFIKICLPSLTGWLSDGRRVMKMLGCYSNDLLMSCLDCQHCQPSSSFLSEISTVLMSKPGLRRLAEIFYHGVTSYQGTLMVDNGTVWTPRFSWMKVENTMLCYWSGLSLQMSNNERQGEKNDRCFNSQLCHICRLPSRFATRLSISNTLSFSKLTREVAGDIGFKSLLLRRFLPE